MTGQFPCLAGHNCLAAFQIVELVGFMHCVRICSIDSISASRCAASPVFIVGHLLPEAPYAVGVIKRFV